MAPSGRRADKRDGEVPTPAVVGLVRQLGTVLAELGLSEVDVAWGELRVRVQRASAPPAPAAVGAGAPGVTAPAVTEPIPDSMVTVEAPMVGTFYRASSPSAEPYVREGDVVKEGQILCIIEAMKLMNEIEAKVSGRITRILVENAHPVEYGQPLFVIDPLR
jgi:acetyl-CoA carboxylase biotin carboxyl carrier protein